MYKFFRQIIGFSLVEAMLSIGLFALLITALVGIWLNGQESTAIAGQRARASYLAEEGLEAVRNIRDAGFANLTPGTYGLATSSNSWILLNSSDTTDIYNRHIDIGIIDGNRRVVTSTVTWQQNLQRLGQVSFVTYFDNWQVSSGNGHNGMLVFGDGGTVSDRVSYATFDASTNLWSATSSVADVDTGSTNRALYNAKLYSSKISGEKILISRHFNGTTQYIYAQVYNATSSSWGNVQLLGQFNATTFLAVDNFDGTYLEGAHAGDFMAVYSINSVTPQFRIWNGSTWSAASIPMQAITVAGNPIPNYIVAKNRPGTAEVMVGIYDQAKGVSTQYFNGGTYATASWGSNTVHSDGGSGSSNLERDVDFDWSLTSSTVGALAYTNTSNNKIMSVRIWRANGSGGGVWGTVGNTAAQSNAVAPIAIKAFPASDNFLTCNQDTKNPSNLRCYKSDYTPTITANTNSPLEANVEGSNERAYDIGFELQNATSALAVFSYKSGTPWIPAFKKYNVSANSWDSTDSNISFSPYTLGNIEPIKIIPLPGSDDMMVIMGDSNNDLYSAMWDGTNSAMYATADGRKFTRQAVNGALANSFWFDFAWDN